MEAKKILKFLEFSAKLKSEERTIKISDNRHESVADHSWQLCLMAWLVSSHLENKVDLFKTLKMAIIHDLVEAEVGDTPHGLTAVSRKAQQKKEAKEKIAIENIRKMLDGDISIEISELWHEYEKGESGEAKFLKALNSLEANFQSILYDVSYWDDFFYKIALTKADKHCKDEPILSELNQAITAQMREEMKKIGLSVEEM